MKIEDRMKSDMHIEKYDGEMEENYISRIIYSAICEWMRYSILDETTQNYNRKSKAYILKRIRSLLKTMIEAFPISKEWIGYCDDNEEKLDNIIHGLRDKMLFGGELIEFDNGIGLPTFSERKCTRDYIRIVGLSESKMQSKFVGITKVIRNYKQNEYEMTNDMPDIEEYIDIIYKSAEWNECNYMEKFEYFNPYSKNPPYQSWIEQVPKNCNKILARTTIYNGAHEYYLIKKEKEKYWSTKISDFLFQQREYRRILLGLRKKVNNIMQANYIKKDSVYILNLYCVLPLFEEGIINTYCWPLNSIDDKLNFVVPVFIWNDIKKILENNLGIKLKEKM